MIQDVAERLGNMDVDVVTKALAKSTQRIISAKYMKAGMGDGGTCHPRDNIALRYLANKYNIEIEEEELTPVQIDLSKKKEGVFLVSSYANKFFQNQLF